LGRLPGWRQPPQYRFDFENIPVTDLVEESFLFDNATASKLPTAVEYTVLLGFGTPQEGTSLEEIEPIGLNLLGTIGKEEEWWWWWW